MNPNKFVEMQYKVFVGDKETDLVSMYENWLRDLIYTYGQDNSITERRIDKFITRVLSWFRDSQSIDDVQGYKFKRVKSIEHWLMRELFDEETCEILGV